MTYCDNPSCDNEATEVVPVSISADVVEFRCFCSTCSEAYNVGAQHGRFRAIRQLRACANVLDADEHVIHTVSAAMSCLDSVDDPGEEGLTPPVLDEDEDEEE